MVTIEEYRSYSKEIEDILRLDSFTIAVKMIRNEEIRNSGGSNQTQKGPQSAPRAMPGVFPLAARR